MSFPFTVGSRWQITAGGNPPATPIVVTNVTPSATPTRFTAHYEGTPPQIPAYSLVR
jgi:hypothetical protein